MCQQSSETFQVRSALPRPDSGPSSAAWAGVKLRDRDTPISLVHDLRAEQGLHFVVNDAATLRSNRAFIFNDVATNDPQVPSALD